MSRRRCINTEGNVSSRRSGRLRGSMKLGTKAFILITALQVCVGVPTRAQESEVRQLFEWSTFGKLPSTSVRCAGVSEGALVLVGDSTYVIETESLRVQAVEGRFGATHSMSASWGDEILCIGEEVVALRWQDGALRRRLLPPLPTVGSGAVVENSLYLVSTSDDFWALDLAADEPTWERLAGWPGPPRQRVTVVALGGHFYVFGGLGAGPGGVLQLLTDVYRYRPDAGWERLEDMPAMTMVELEAVAMGTSHVLVFGSEGDCGGSRQVLAYHTITDTWVQMGTAPPGGAVIPLDAGVVTLGDTSLHRGTLVGTTGNFGLVNYLVLGAYFLVLVGMGFYFLSRERSDLDYFLARQRIPWWAAGVSIFGTQLSAITFMAIPATAFATDWVYSLGQVTIVLLAPVIIYVYLPFFRRLDVTTAYEYLELRFSVAVRLFGSAAFVLFQLGRMGIVIFLPAIALSAATGMSMWAAVLLMGLLSTLYTTLGGIEAVVWSDVLQVVVLMGGAVLSLGLIVSSVEGGAMGLLSTAAAHGKFHAVNLTWDMATASVWVVVVGWTLSNLVPYTADQTVVQRYLTTKDEAAAARSIWTNAALTIPATVIFFGLGTALFVFYHEHAAALEPSLPVDAIFPLFIVQQLPVGVAGLLVAGIFAAAMSSLDSSLNSVSTTLVTDWYRRFVPETTEAQRLSVARRLTFCLGLVVTGTGLLLASFDINSLWDVFLELLGLLGGTLAGLFALGILTRRAHAAGALAGVVASVAALYLIKTLTAVHFFLYAGIGIMTCVVVGYLTSLVLPHDRVSLEGLTLFTVNSSRAD